MSPERAGVERDFYRTCAALLGAEDDYMPRRFAKVERWNNRSPGNARCPGFGLIRMFGPHHIQLSLRRPIRISTICASAEEAFSILRGHHRASNDQGGEQI
jgi:hypothetical protein